MTTHQIEVFCIGIIVGIIFFSIVNWLIGQHINDATYDDVYKYDLNKLKENISYYFDQSREFDEKYKKEDLQTDEDLENYVQKLQDKYPTDEHFNNIAHATTNYIEDKKNNKTKSSSKDFSKRIRKM